jgi:hypothetical protein
MAFPSTSYRPSISLPPSGRSLPLSTPKHKRGGQPGNQNARKVGTFSSFQPGPITPTRLLVHDLQQRLQDPASPLDQIMEDARVAKRALPLPALATLAEFDEFSPVFGLVVQLQNVIMHAHAACIPSVRLSEALSSIAHDPFGWFERGYRDCGISRDADSFFIVSENSAHYSPLSSNHPRLATNLTNSQWAILAPLIPPDPSLGWLTGEPPVIIAANRWGFTQYYSTGEFNDLSSCKTITRFSGVFQPSVLSSPLHTRSRPRREGFGQGSGAGPSPHLPACLA